MATLERDIRRQLRTAGISKPAIDAAWPDWWSSDAESSVSAAAELRYTVARRLGLAPRSLFEGSPRFIWKDETRFKNLGALTDREAAVLSSFAVSTGRCAISATRWPGVSLAGMAAADLRTTLLKDSPYIGLSEVLALSWGVGIPVLYLQVFPLAQKRMHAVSVSRDDRFAVLIGQRSKYAAQVAFFVAHELAHIALGHVGTATALLDVEDPLTAEEPDAEELDADRFALELLTGSSTPEVISNTDDYSASQLAQAATDASQAARVDPGIIVLCLAYRTKRWATAFGALKALTNGGDDVVTGVNGIATTQLDWTLMSADNEAFLRTIMGADV